MERGQYERFVLNDTRPTAAFFKKCAEGGMRNETRWISRDDFFKLKDTDMYVRMCFSFGNDGRTYAYSRKVEPYKRACHFAIVFDKWADLFETAPEIAPACHEACEGMTGIHERRLAFKRGLLKALKELGWDYCKSSVNFHECAKVRGRIDSVHLRSLESGERLGGLDALGGGEFKTSCLLSDVAMSKTSSGLSGWRASAKKARAAGSRSHRMITAA